jgi:hypothetical protein
VNPQNSFLARVGWSGAGCLVDLADYASVDAVAPGQFITFFGGGDAVTFSGTPAELLYVGGGQINVRVPDSAASRILMEVSGNGRIIDRRMLSVEPRVPALFVVPDFYAEPVQSCSVGVVPAIALNEDGTPNSCGNPAEPGSMLTLFVNGAGTGEPSPEVEVLLNRQPAPARYAGNGRIEVGLPEGVHGGTLVQVSIQGTPARPGFASVSIR